MPNSPQAVDASRITATDLAVISLAAFRLVRLATQDDVTEPLRVAVKARFGAKWGEAAECPWCLGAHVASGVGIIALRWPRARRWMLIPALSAAAGLLSTLDSALGRAWQQPSPAKTDPAKAPDGFYSLGARR